MDQSPPARRMRVFTSNKRSAYYKSARRNDIILLDKTLVFTITPSHATPFLTHVCPSALPPTLQDLYTTVDEIADRKLYM